MSPLGGQCRPSVFWTEMMIELPRGQRGRYVRGEMSSESQTDRLKRHLSCGGGSLCFSGRESDCIPGGLLTAKGVLDNVGDHQLRSMAIGRSDADARGR